MPVVEPNHLREFSERIFKGAGASTEEALIVSEALVDANLAGHDSHGVMRIPSYVEWIGKGWIRLGVELKIEREAEAFAVVDGGRGFGQVMGRRATQIAVEKAKRAGVATVSGRDCAHLGRLGDYPRIAAEAGMAASMYINTHGGGILVAPFGGIDRRLSANPIAFGLPRGSGSPIVVDISTCTLAEGKIRNFRAAGQQVPEGVIIDSEGRPTTDPNEFYGPPPGALLPVGGHKGYALGLAADLLAGGLSGAGCSGGTEKRVANSFLLHVIDIERFGGLAAFEAEADRLVEWVKSSRKAEGFDEILVAGEPEERTSERRRREGIPIVEPTWEALQETAQGLGVSF